VDGIGEDAKQKMLDAAEQAIRVSAEDLLGRAQRLAPLEEGTLRGSGHLEPEVGVNRTATGLECHVIFDTPYAAAQHEASGPPSWEHAERPLHYTTPGTGPGYLSQPLKDMGPRYVAAIAANVRRALANE
jgi:hypothetical protein